MKADDRVWFEGLWARHAADVYGYAARRVGRQMADDVVSEVFVVAWRNRTERPERDLPWLYGVARRVVSTQYRSAGRQSALEAKADADPTARRRHEEDPDVSVWVSEAIGKLDELDREALLLTAWEGLTPAEAAVVVGMSASAFRMRLSRARRRLRVELSDSDGLHDARQLSPRKGATVANDLELLAAANPVSKDEAIVWSRSPAAAEVWHEIQDATESEPHVGRVHGSGGPRRVSLLVAAALVAVAALPTRVVAGNRWLAVPIWPVRRVGDQPRLAGAPCGPDSGRARPGVCDGSARLA